MPSEDREVYKKQAGGRGKFADISFEIAPIDHFKEYADDDKKVTISEGFKFINEIVGGNIPREYIPSVEKGFRESMRSEEHTSELQSRGHLVCRLLLEKKNKK